MTITKCTKHTNRFYSVLQFIGLLASAAVLIACSDQAAEKVAPTDESIVPRSISSLLDSDDLAVYLRVQINDTLLSDTEVVSDDSVSVNVPPSLLNASINQISILFYIPAYGNALEALPLASSTQMLATDSDGNTTTLAGRLYQYADSDNDGVFNVHELSVKPFDLDSDSVDNVFDMDSDGDSLNDGNDNLPYEGSNTAVSVVELQQTLRLEVDESMIDVPVEQLLGDTQELLQIASTAQRLPLRTPILWPAAAEAAELVNKRWTAYGLKAGTQELCPQWQQSIGTSSIRSSVQGTVLLYFRRDDGSASLAVLGEGDVEDLDIYDNTAAGNGRGPFNDALRMILVPRSTVGWLELYTDQDFTGRVCAVNVTSDRVIAHITVD